MLYLEAQEMNADQMEWILTEVKWTSIKVRLLFYSVFK